MGGFLNIGGSVKKISGVFGNVEGRIVKAKSLWVNKDGVPVKVFSLGGGLFILVSYGTTSLKNTKNLTEFSTVVTASSSRKFFDILYLPEEDKFISFARNSNQSVTYLFSSVNGLSWTDEGSVTGGISDGLFCRAGENIYYSSALAGGYVFVSTDRGVTWERVSMNNSLTATGNQYNVQDCALVDGIIYAVSRKSYNMFYSRLVYSLDGKNFSTLDDGEFTPTSLAYGNGLLAASSNGSVLFGTAESDLTKFSNWVKSSLPEGDSGDSDNYIMFHAGEFYLFTSQNDQSCVLKSSNCVDWSLLGITTWDGLVHTSGSKALRSMKAQKLTEETTIFFASGMSSTTPLFYSYDLLNWVSVDPSDTALLAEARFI